MKGLLLTEEAPARRGFLRSLVMAPVAALATHRLIVPAQTIITPDDADARLKTHLAGAEAALRDLYPGAHVRLWGNCLEGSHSYWNERFASGDRSAIACIGIDASLYLP